jgi:hypothetical protein
MGTLPRAMASMIIEDNLASRSCADTHTLTVEKIPVSGGSSWLTLLAGRFSS